MALRSRRACDPGRINGYIRANQGEATRKSRIADGDPERTAGSDPRGSLMNLLGHNVREGRHSLRSFVPLLVILGSLSILVAAQLTASDPVLRLRAIPVAQPEK